MLSRITSGNLLHLLICFPLYQVLWKHHGLWNSLQWMSNGPTGFQGESCCWWYLEYPLLWWLIPCCSSNTVLRSLHKHQTHLVLLQSLWTLILSLTQFYTLGPFSGYCLANLNCRKRVKVISKSPGSILLWASIPGIDPISISKMDSLFQGASRRPSGSTGAEGSLVSCLKAWLRSGWWRYHTACELLFTFHAF